MCWGVNTHMTDGEGGLVPQGWDRVYNDEGESGASQLSVPPSPTPFPSSPSLLVTIILVLAFFCIPEEEKNTEEWGILLDYHSPLELGDGQFSERCDVDGSFFNSDAVQIIFGKA